MRRLAKEILISHPAVIVNITIPLSHRRHPRATLANAGSEAVTPPRSRPGPASAVRVGRPDHGRPPIEGNAPFAAEQNALTRRTQRKREGRGGSSAPSRPLRLLRGLCVECFFLGSRNNAFNAKDAEETRRTRRKLGAFAAFAPPSRPPR